ncbi:MAG TPA: trypsin-like peptidase domain-containing protein [Lacibacter sp.]|mgnify:CR=1 FL=1|nr:trypsin-like peptidase domain-containing protein [Lacibacter sp.]HMO89524.1 trypsin-like peptidase domain-containing protein [Lacibacter sp.]HMP86019.1 trypsin-like peptidase domain-containing protein [Lacibacter sp.]
MKVKHILLMVVVSATTAIASVVLYAKFAAPRQNILYSQQQTPVNYAGLYDSGFSGGLSGPVDFEPAAATTIPAVVHIKTKTNPRQTSQQQRRRSPFSDLFGDDFFDDFFGGRGQNIPQMASGSGVFISGDGFIVTNNHVIDGADEITVTLHNKKQYKAKLIATDANTDLAVIKVEGSGFPYLLYGNSDEVRVGQWVMAVGYPLTLETTVTAGIVSAKYRYLGVNQRKARPGANTVESFIQTDAAVNQGNSGGALINTSGQLIGINAAIASPTGSYAGYSYAIPVNIVKKVVDDLIKFGTVQRAYLGIRPAANGDDGTDSQIKEGDGVEIGEILSKSAAEEGGLKKGDKIVKLDNKPVSTWTELTGTIASYRPGQKISVTYIRNGKEMTSALTLRNSAGNTEIVKAGVLDKLGVELAALDARRARELGVEGGVEIKTLSDGLIANQTTIKKGFIIIRAGGKVVKSTDDLSKAIEAAGNSIIIEGIYPGYEGVYTYAINELRNEP